MKEEMVRTGWTNVFSWLYTAFVAVAYVALYVLVALGMTNMDATLSNLLLAFLALIGPFVLLYVVDRRIYRFHHDGDPAVLRKVLWYGTFTMFALVIWHAAIAYTPAAQFGAHAPATVVLVALVAIFIRGSNLKEH